MAYRANFDVVDEELEDEEGFELVFERGSGEEFGEAAEVELDRDSDLPFFVLWVFSEGCACVVMCE